MPIRVLHVYKDIFPPVAGGIEKHIDGLRAALPDVVSHVLVASRTPPHLPRSQPDQGTATIDIARSKDIPSRLLLPVVQGVSVPTGLLPCPGLRGEPCRNYQPFVNRTASPQG
jgi:hypothetical protein